MRYTFATFNFSPHLHLSYSWQICHVDKDKTRELFKHFLPASTLSSTDQTTSSSSRLSNPSRYKVFQIINPLNKGILVTHWNLRKLILLIFETLAWNFGLGVQSAMARWLWLWCLININKFGKFVIKKYVIIWAILGFLL